MIKREGSWRKTHSLFGNMATLGRRILVMLHIKVVGDSYILRTKIFGSSTHPVASAHQR